MVLGIWLATVAAAAGEATGPRVDGQVLDAHREPVVGAELVLRPLPSDYALARSLHPGFAWGKGSDDAVATTATDAAGRFVLHAPAVGMWSVMVTAPGRAEVAVDLVPLLHDEALRPIVLRLAQEITVAVVDVEGKPVPGARIVLDGRPAGQASRGVLSGEARAWSVPQRAVTDASGRVRVPAPSGGKRALQVIADGFVPWYRAERSQASERVVLRRGSPRDLLVRDRAGRPIAQAVIRGVSSAAPLALTDAHGFVRLDGIPGQDLKLDILVADGGYGRVTLPPVPRAERSEIVVDPPGEVTGGVVSLLGRTPIADAMVWHVGAPSLFVRSDAKGRYRLVVAARGHGGEGDRLRAAAWGYFPASSAGWVPTGRVPTGRVPASTTLALPRAARVRGVVVDGEDRGIAGATILEMASADRAVSARSSVDGRFVLPATAAGRPLRLLARRSGFTPTQVEVPSSPGGGRAQPIEVRVRMSQGRNGFGVVIDEADRPIADAVVALAPSRQGRRADDKHLESLQARTDKDGRFVLEDISVGTFDLSARAAGFAPITVPGVAITDGGESIDLGALVLGTGARVVGWVLDAQGQPLVGAAILVDTGELSAANRSRAEAVERTHTWSAADGRFQIDSLVPDQKVTLQVSLAGYASAQVRAVRPPTSGDLEIVLDEAMRVRGTVSDEQGNPIADAHLHLAAETADWSETPGRAAASLIRIASSEPAGSFEIDGVVAGRWSLRVQAEGYRDGGLALIEVVAGEEPVPVRVVLQRGGTVAGRVVGGGGEPVADARVSALSAGDSSIGAPPHRSATTDRDGRYRLVDLPLGRLTFSAEHPEHPRKVRELEVRPDENSLDFELDDGWSIAGRVLDATDRPVGGARVYALPAGESVSLERRRGQGLAAVFTAADGSFEVAVQSEGKFVVRAEKEGYAEARSDEVVPIRGRSARAVTLRLEAGSAIVGRVLGLAFDELSKVRVLALSNDRSTTPTSTGVDFDGRYRLDRLLAGDWVVYAGVGESGKSVQESVTLAAGGREVSQDLTFGDGLTLSGQVVRGALPVAGARVRARATGKLAGAWAVAEQDGRFRLEGLEAGTYQVVASDHTEGSEQQLEVRLDSDREILVELETYTARGRVLDDGEGAPIEGARVALISAERAGAGPSAIRSTDARGAFQVAGIAPGRYRLQASKEGYGNGVREIEIDGRGEVTAIELRLHPAEGLTLDVQYPTGGSANVVTLIALDDGGQPWMSGRFGAMHDGLIRLDGLPAGRWTLLAAAPGTATVRQRVEAPGGPVRLRLPASGGLAVRVPELMGTGSRAHLTLSDPLGWQYHDVGGSQDRWELVNGMATLPLVPAGTWTLSVRTADEQTTWTTSSHVIAGRTLDVYLD